jgi:hypothetical protein
MFSGPRNRMQHLYLTSGNRLVCDSEESTRQCLGRYFLTQQFKVWGSPNRELPFNDRGLYSLVKLIRSGHAQDFLSLRDMLAPNGIDMVCFSQDRREVWVIELKGWTRTPDDFNVAIHQILKRVVGISANDGLRPNVKFACAFPHFADVPEWEPKLHALRRLPKNPEALLEFSSSSLTKKEDGFGFLLRFIEGPIKISELVARGQLQFLLVTSPDEMRPC